MTAIAAAKTRQRNLAGIPAEKLRMIVRSHELALRHEIFKLDAEQEVYNEVRGGQQRRGVVHHEFSSPIGDDGSRLTISCPAMGAFELRVLHSILALMTGRVARGGRRSHYMASDTSVDASAAWKMLAIPEKMRRSPSDGPLSLGERITVLRLSVNQVNRCIGTIDKTMEGSDKVFAALVSLSKIALTYVSGDGRRAGATRLISDPVLVDNRIQVCVNPVMTGVILRDGGRLNYYAMDEMRGLRKPSAILLHSALSAFIPFGGTRQVGKETLEGYLWRHKLPDDSRKRFGRDRTIQAAITDLCKIGWRVDRDGIVFSFTRPARSGVDQPSLGLM